MVHRRVGARPSHAILSGIRANIRAASTRGARGFLILPAVPEGDTIYRTATALRAALLGKALVSFVVPRHVGLLPTADAVVERVESHGKHLEIGFDDAVVLHTHMRMTGSWHLYRLGENWRKPVSQARVILEVAGWKAVCFNAPVVELYRAREASRHPGLGSLGPDLCREDADITECVARIDRYCAPQASVAEMLLDQRIACGVGNVFKSEVLWACELQPFSPVEALSVDQRFRLLETASTMLQANLGRSGRITVPGVAGGLAVYGRTGKPCVRCGGTIEVRRHGQQARVTYFCPECQVLLGYDTMAPVRAIVDTDGPAPDDQGRADRSDRNDRDRNDRADRPIDASIADGGGRRPDYADENDKNDENDDVDNVVDRRSDPRLGERPGRAVRPDLALGEDRHPAARLWRERSLAAVKREDRRGDLRDDLRDDVRPVRPDRLRGAPARRPNQVIDPLLARRAAGR